MSDVEGFSEGISKASPAGLVGKDELGMSALYAGFKPAPAGVEKVLMGMVGFESPAQVDGSWVRLSPDDFVVAVHHAASDVVSVLWVEEGETKSFYSKRADKEITFREKRLTGFQVTGTGESGLDEARALVSEFREAVELVVMRTLGGFARAEADLGGDEEASLEAEVDEMRALMEG